MATLITDGKHSYEFEYTLPEAPWPSSRAPQSLLKTRGPSENIGPEGTVQNVNMSTSVLLARP
jgi:hypothetical protein